MAVISQAVQRKEKTKKTFYIFFLIIASVSLVYYSFFKTSTIEVSSSPFLSWEPGKLLVAFLDVGQADATVIVTPEKKIILIDTGQGGSYSQNNSGLRINDYLSLFNKKKIDKIILTHPHSDHIGGFKTISEKFEIGKVYDSGFKSSSTQYANILKIIRDKNIDYSVVSRGDIIQLDNSLNAEVIFTQNEIPDNINANNASVVLRMKFGGVSFLLTGDIEEEVEKILLAGPEKLKTDILKVPHHGGKTSSTQEFLSAVMPKFAVVMCGRNNKHNHPHQKVLDRYKMMKIKLLRTDINGNVEFITDGNKLSLKMQSPENPEQQYKFFKF